MISVLVAVVRGVVGSIAVITAAGALTIAVPTWWVAAHVAHEDDVVALLAPVADDDRFIDATARAMAYDAVLVDQAPSGLAESIERDYLRFLGAADRDQLTSAWREVVGEAHRSATFGTGPVTTDLTPIEAVALGDDFDAAEPLPPSEVGGGAMRGRILAAQDMGRTLPLQIGAGVALLVVGLLIDRGRLWTQVTFLGVAGLVFAASTFEQRSARINESLAAVDPVSAAGPLSPLIADRFVSATTPWFAAVGVAWLLVAAWGGSRLVRRRAESRRPVPLDPSWRI